MGGGALVIESTVRATCRAETLTRINGEAGFFATDVVRLVQRDPNVLPRSANVAGERLVDECLAAGQ
jgi:hypothetical protein